jgi:hypothetical protein
MRDVHAVPRYRRRFSREFLHTGEPSMLSNLSQYSPQGLTPQFPGLGGPINPGLLGQPGTIGGGNLPFGQEFGHTPNQQHPFQGPTNMQNPFALSQFPQIPFAMNPYLQSQPLQNSFAGYAGAPSPAQYIYAVLGQLVQSLSINSTVIQQLGVALQQLSQLVAAQSLQSHPGVGGGQYLAQQNPYAAVAGGYSGFNPQAQAWGASRSQTIQ